MARARRESGPWGLAIEYWLERRRLRQADVVRATGIQPKTISQVARGYHTTTRVLERIARALDAPLDDVLISPAAQRPSRDQVAMFRKMMSDTLRRAGGELDPDVLSLAHEIHALPPLQRDAIRGLIASYRKPLSAVAAHASTPPRDRSPVHHPPDDGAVAVAAPRSATAAARRRRRRTG